jgi:hypothetical protein
VINKLWYLDAPMSSNTIQTDDPTCFACGFPASELAAGEQMRRGFIRRNESGLSLTSADLKTLCPECDESFAVAKLYPTLTATELIRELRRASVADQISVLDWLSTHAPSR